MGEAVERAFGSVCIVGANVCVGGAWLARPAARDADIPVCGCRIESWARQGCGDGCLNRSMRYECLLGYCLYGVRCSNRQLQVGSTLQTAVVDCGEKGVGLITLEDVALGRCVGEYVGEVISGLEAHRRGMIYRHARHAYMLRVSSNRVIDATRFGGMMRFVNNSCSPNCQVEKWSVRGEERCGVFAIRAIQAGEELTIDYHFENSGDMRDVQCLCGSPRCRGLINARRRQRSADAAAQSQPSAARATSTKPMIQLTLDRFFS